MTVDTAPMDLRCLVSTTIAGIQVTTDRHHLMLGAPPEVMGCWDERRLQQVVGNLLTSAVKYTPSGGPITVSIRMGKCSVTVRVRDHGAGLGLYICQGIVTAHGGRIWVESAGPGKGSAFCFMLPRWGGTTNECSIPSDV
jgi:signal transduction histidine kinase